MSTPAIADVALVKDINASEDLLANLNPAEFVVMGTVVYFRGTDATYGQELWRTDGTAAGTFRVTDINPYGDSSPTSLVVSNNVLYFAADDGQHGVELWRSDGTAAGTRMVRDIYSGTVGSTPEYLLDVNGKLYFSANDSVRGWQLWTSDGTEAGTTVADSVHYTSSASKLYYLTKLNDTVVYWANDGVHGYEPWVWNQGGLGTISLIDDINPVAGSGSTPAPFVYLKGQTVSDADQLFFTATDSSGTVRVQSFDGTTVKSGENVVPDPNDTNIPPASIAFENPKDLTISGNYVIFQAAAVSDQHLMLVAHYGPSTGVMKHSLVKDDFGSGSALTDFGVSEGNISRAFFVEVGVNGNMTLWTVTQNNAALVTEIGSIFDMAPPKVASANRVYYVARDIYTSTSATDVELYTLGGTASTTLVEYMANLNPYGSSLPTELTTVDIHDPNDSKINPFTLIMMSAYDGLNGRELWVIDPNRLVEPAKIPTIERLSDVRQAGNANPRDLTSVGSYVYFVADDPVAGQSVWRTNGATAGTTQQATITDVTSYSLAPYMDDLVFATSSDGSSYKLWRMVGTVRVPLANLSFVSANSLGVNELKLVSSGDYVFFAASDSIAGTELWVSDGTDVGSKLLKDINSLGDSTPSNLLDVDGTLYFIADDGNGVRAPWFSNGKSTGTLQVQNVEAWVGSEHWAARLGTNVYFSADDGLKGKELWKAAFGKQGAVRLTDINPVGDASPRLLTVVVRGLDDKLADPADTATDLLYFVADDGVNGDQLWKSDGTSAGTVMVKKIRSGSVGTPITEMVALGEKLFLVADDGVHGYELWISDGTDAGTVMVTDLNDAGASTPTNLVASEDKIYFSAFTSRYSRELWQSDGTAAGTLLVKDVSPLGSSEPTNLLVNQGKLYFSARNSDYGRELWNVDVTYTPPVDSGSGGSGAPQEPPQLPRNGGGGSINLIPWLLMLVFARRMRRAY